MYTEDDSQENDTNEGDQPFAYSRPSVSHIKNKELRNRLNLKLNSIKKKQKRKAREKRKREIADGEEPKPVKKQRTLENTRESDDTFVAPGDEEVLKDEEEDEFGDYFKGDYVPKVYITTSPKRTQQTRIFVDDLVKVFPNWHYHERMKAPIRKVIQKCKDEGYTDLVVINEDHKKPNGMLICHLPDGPTALFRLSNVETRDTMLNVATPSSNNPEVILNNFSTRLGHTIGRMLAVLVPHNPNFKERNVMTYHNQRDFIFFRLHRYIFDSSEKARLQEIGPRFTIRLKYLMHGTFDREHGEYEWVQKKELLTSRRRFFI
jgi:ribosome production factor 1